MNPRDLNDNLHESDTAMPSSEIIVSSKLNSQAQLAIQDLTRIDPLAFIYLAATNCEVTFTPTLEDQPIGLDIEGHITDDTIPSSITSDMDQALAIFMQTTGNHETIPNSQVAGTNQSQAIQLIVSQSPQPSEKLASAITNDILSDIDQTSTISMQTTGNHGTIPNSQVASMNHSQTTQLTVAPSSQPSKKLASAITNNILLYGSRETIRRTLFKKFTDYMTNTNMSEGNTYASTFD